MPLDLKATKLANLFNPQVVGDMINNKLVDAIKFSPLARIDTTLVGRPGSKLTLPSFKYIGDAEKVGEGEDIKIKQLQSATKEVEVFKIGNGVTITDEAVLSGYGNPKQEAINQLRLSVASAIDNDVLTTLGKIQSNMTITTKTVVITPDEIADALVKFGEDIDGTKVLLVSPEIYGELRKANDWIPGTEVAAEFIIRGSVGMIHGCQVVVSNKLTAKKEAYIVKPGAVAIYLKREILVETDRNIINKSTILTVDKHYTTYLFDESKAIKIKTGSAPKKAE